MALPFSWKLSQARPAWRPSRKFFREQVSHISSGTLFSYWAVLFMKLLALFATLCFLSCTKQLGSILNFAKCAGMCSTPWNFGCNLWRKPAAKRSARYQRRRTAVWKLICEPLYEDFSKTTIFLRILAHCPPKYRT